MNNIKLLDCTLRDGGYINDWKFGKSTITGIVQKLVHSGIDYIEVGFLKNCKYDENVAVFNTMEEVNRILPPKHEDIVYAVMALHNTYHVEKLEPYSGGAVEVIRVTFHNYDIDEGLIFSKEVIEKGYKCFCNPINIMGYTDEEIIQLIKKVNSIKPFGFSIVDTFGSMMKEDLTRIYQLVEHNLNKDIVIGIHLHENLSMAFSLAQEFVQMHSSMRKCVIDASLLGMGRVPGNLCLELIGDYLNRYMEKQYGLDSIYDAIDNYITDIRKKNPWGYNIAYALSAKYNLHRNYSEHLINKGKLCACQINHILSIIETSKKAQFDQEYIEKIYLEYLSIDIDDKEVKKQLKYKLENSEILILAPGNSINKNSNAVHEYIRCKNPIVITANFNGNEYVADYYFFSNLKRYDEYKNKMEEKKTIISSNILISNGEGIVVNYNDLIIKGDNNMDNCVLMLIKLLVSIGVNSVY